MSSDSTGPAWIHETEAALRLAKNANEIQRQNDYLEDAKADFNRLLPVLRELVVSASLMRRHGWGGLALNAELARDLDSAEVTLDARPVKRVAAALERLNPEVRASLIDAWREVASEGIGDLGELLVLAQLLMSVEDVATLALALQVNLQELSTTQRSLPTERSLQLLAEAQKTRGKLEKKLHPDAVRKFLSAIAHGGAPLRLLTAEVSDWLQLHSAVDRFKIVAGPPPGGSGV